MGKGKKAIRTPDSESLEDVEVVEDAIERKAIRDELPDDDEVIPKGKQIPKHAVNFTDKEIKALNIEDQVRGLLRAKREADEAKDKIASRKIRRALRAAGFYVSKAREDRD